MLTKEQVIQGMTPRKRAIIYCRVSTDRQEQDGESLEYQEEKCRRYAELHGMDVIVVLPEAKSGFIHYSLREKLTLARQMVRDGLADVIIVWDLRRFSRNFVHSAMIFEEIESAGGEVISVSENIDNSLTGKLIRSILAWSAESEREKILEYSNRRWQTRLELGLPIGTGAAPYGWKWADTDKTKYLIDKEQAVVRFSIFEMFVEMDMSIRSIAHKLTEDGIPAPYDWQKLRKKGEAAKKGIWSPSTVHGYLKAPENIGILVICKQKNTLDECGKLRRVANPNKKEILGGIPAIIPVALYERAQRKLAANREDKSHLPHDLEQYLLRGHIYCAVCNHKMSPRNHMGGHYYYCNKRYSRYDTCPNMPNIKADTADTVVWQECCLLFERLDVIRATLEEEIQRSVQSLLEHIQGKEHIIKLQAEIAYAKQQQSQFLEGMYLHNVIAQDIQIKTEQLQRFEEEYAAASHITAVTATYKDRVTEFLAFLDVMKGNYQDATFQEKRNALDVLGVKVVVRSYDKHAEGRKESKKDIQVTYSPIFTGVHASNQSL
ncbi:MAG TPA: recombinase family protein [Ktedonobacteraceae bacterium]|nr:recombinase family protein [Ktedonobacteraceae bacterium]